LKTVVKKWRGLWARRPAGASSAGLESLKLRYLEFKQLLRANNEVLSIIAEIEGRPADAGLIRSRQAEAGVRVFKMIGHLSHIAGKVYPGLSEAFDRIWGEIEAAGRRMARPQDAALVLSLDEVGDDWTDLVGSKAAHLARLKRLGLPVLPGFVVTTASFRRLMEATRLGDDVLRELTFLEDLSFRRLTGMSRGIAARATETPLPPDLADALGEAARGLTDPAGGPVHLAVRSSAVGEDSEVSFAGQYKTVLNVPPERVGQAYLEVAASLYEPQAVLYRRRIGWRDADAEMAVLVLPMLDPLASGVMYTRDPRSGPDGPMIVNAVHGLGPGLLDGALTPDEYRLARDGDVRLTGVTRADQRARVALSEAGPVEEPLPEDLVARPVLNAGQVETLARLGLDIEAGAGEPQDVEWSLLQDGRFVILQSRPLAWAETPRTETPWTVPKAAPILSGGEAARFGAGAGPACPIRRDEDLDGFPQGGVLVARRASPIFGGVLDRAAAVVTEVGGVTGHMASLAREYGVPALVGAKGALDQIRAGETITVDATERKVYRGRVEAVLEREQEAVEKTRPAAPGRAPHPAARLITPLTLTDPYSPAFKPENCRTYHDLIRFMHEKSFSEMFRLGDRIGLEARNEAKKLSRPLPFELWLIDLGGGLAQVKGLVVGLSDVLSLPARRFIAGLLDPRINWQRPRPAAMQGMFSVFSGTMINMNPKAKDREFGQKTYAIVSKRYLNFHSRVGYHFAALDCVCGPVLNDNYISFYFHGGAAATDRRVFRVDMITEILARRGFEVSREKDLVRAFVKKDEEETIGRILEDLGRLMLFTRQMDMFTRDQETVDWLIQAFESGNFNIDLRPERPTAGPPSRPFNNL